MNTHMRCFARQLLLLVWLLAIASPRVGAEEYFDRYGLSAASSTLDLGGQPLGYPSGVVSAVMQRDRVLRNALVAIGHPLKVHAFRRGADMVGLLGEHRLEAGLLGDMPTILVASANQVVVVGLVKQTSTAIVAADGTQVSALAGKRIGYVPLSSAHSTLLQGLASAGLKETDAKLVPLGIDDMPDALARGEIDAFSGWEPAPSLALGRSEHNRVVFRGLSTDYFVVDRDFEKRAPEAARILVAGFVRAIEWMRLSQRNLESASHWVMVDAQVFAGHAPAATAQQIMSITRRDLLSVPSAPVILRSPGAPHPLKNEYEFLQALGKIPHPGRWENVVSAFRYEGLTRVLAEANRYQVRVFDYDE